ncbi:hypothetical protein A3I95_00160 [Candidatus Nomurabacteria bacterium RIFCSPLOWO2_02_FULL_44_12]|uniref:EfeO-type cupredoxin-like domain-containing protein n=1 Tax=Candidatus Nomurabacteria bacterium RIFCSPLOWO2_12_FULL_44_11 TaxID=1801796 RepID=A0A1F6Y4G0_9BACT|nr:MAG: hypothetical protein A3E95_02300 [Candidatus Nomurabacteria bacterium RIFCSPHIGHO2_12_FULL_44_22b]OGJ01232.1 MAG: hypothetical protein A3G53_03740 [Candidatus Nomurabacteria bacterium RIFCSPLOWO2_12_FULL_44_11]OGJ08090.1 MAG: hypothetical protein A3I95_00160 [Candidatus Nomurabacteria bacterium RIFCSPLOWO2_02_FULL_44_12]
MKNTIIIIVVLVLIVLGAFFLVNKGKVEAPVAGETTEDSGAVSNTMPVPGMGGVEEMVVEQVGAEKEFTVTGQNFSFSPATLKVNKGDRVKIIFKNTQGFHNFVIDRYGLATPQKQSPDTEVLEFTADKVGSFEYYCAVGTHRQQGMRGTLLVE